MITYIISRNVPDFNLGIGGDLTFFNVERKDGSAMPYVDVLSCGNGQWGGLGNALYSNAQGTPLRARAVSGLLECKHSTFSCATYPISQRILTHDRRTDIWMIINRQRNYQ